MQAAKTKWFRWLDLPHVSAFPGACYSSFYRPTEGSKMRNLGRPFEEVNTELLIQKIYEKVRPIQAATPAGTYTRRGVFFVDVMKPEGRPLKIRWSLNGNRLSEFDGFSQIDASRLNVPASGATLLVTVVDETSAVRDEELRRKLLTQTMSWKLKP